MVPRIVGSWRFFTAIFGYPIDEQKIIGYEYGTSFYKIKI